MNKLSEYQAIIVDLDGTLYYQNPIRFAMFIEMAFQFWKISDFLIVIKYRKLFESGLSEKERLIKLPKTAPSIIRNWMIERPCHYIAKYRDSYLIRILTEVRNRGTLIVVYSDYPVSEKLAALGFMPDVALCSEDTGFLKPEAQGLKEILLQMEISTKHCLVIGDRIEKDGLLAKNLGADMLIVPKRMAERKTVYKNVLKI